MRQRPLHTAALLAAVGALFLTACAPPGGSGVSSPPPTERTAPTETSTSAEGGSDAGTLSFEDGATLLPGAEINMGGSLGTDAGWTEIPAETPGRWSYANTDGTCTASYRQGPISGATGMDDVEASDAALANMTGWSVDDLAPLLNDGSFIRHGETDARIAHRQASVRVDDGGTLSGSLVAARAFVAASYSVELTVTCDGADIDVVAGEVLGKTVVQVVEP